MIRIVIETELQNYKYAIELLGYQPLVAEFLEEQQKLHGWKEVAFHGNNWRFNDLRLAVLLKEKFLNVDIDETISIDFVFAQTELDEERKREARAMIIKESKDSSLEVGGLKEELYPYQKIGVEFFVNSRGRAILADQMGTGKTAQTLAYLVHSKQKKTLVICPASVKHSWEKEIQKWTKLRYKIVNSQSDPDIFSDKRFDVIIINYDILIKFMKLIMSADFTCIVADEFHYIKNSSAKRTKVFKKIAQKIPSIILLSGTPFLSRPVELFNGLNIIDPRTWNSFYDFTARYCQGHQGRFGWDASGAGNIDELKDRIGKYFLRRTKAEALPGLPEKVFIYRPIDLDEGIRAKYDLALDNFGRFLREVRGKKTPEILKSLQAEKLVKLGELRQLAALGKINATQEIIEEILDAGEKMLVFSCYNETLIQLHEKFKKKSVLLIGSTDEDERKEVIDKFQSDPNTKIFFGGIRSAGIGITLTEATNVIFIDMSWNPADHSQAIDRASRPGSKGNHLNIYTLYANDTVDEFMMDLLEKKQLLFDRIIEGATGNLKGGNFMNDILKMIEKKFN